MTATVVHAIDSFNSTRKIQAVASGSLLHTLAPLGNAPTLCVLNGEPLSRTCWDGCALESGDVAVFVTLPAGGGDSNPFQIVLAIVLVVAGAFTGNPYLIYAGIGLGVSGLIPTPKVPVGLQPVESPSPTYNVALSGNSARIGQPLPVPYGRHLIFPDFAAQPYTEFQDNDSFYHFLLCIGNTGDIAIESITIDDTDISSFEEVQTQLVGPSFTSSQSLVSPVVVNAPEVAAQNMETFRVVGPFAATGPGLNASRLGLDFIMPRGLYFASDSGALTNKTINWKVEVRQIDELGSPISEWSVIGTETYTAATNEPQRLTKNYTVSPARYEVRVSRTDTRDDNSRAAHDIEWAAMRAYIDTVAALEPTATYLAGRIRATSQLSGSSQRRIAVIIRRKLAVWNAESGWSAPVETRSIAWALADILRNSTYGGGVLDNRIDLVTLTELDALWTDRGDHFDGIFDKRVTMWQALTTVARAGRARPLLRGNVVTFVRDSEQTLPSAMFNMRNIQRNSFAVDYSLVTEDSPDGVKFEYFDARTWNMESVIVPLPGITEPENISTGSLIGVTSKQQALREAAYAAYDLALRRTTVRFTTEMEGHLPTYGDLIAVSHDVPDWGTSADVTAFDVTAPDAPILTLSEPVPWTSVQHYALLRDSSGNTYGPFTVSQGTALNKAVFNESLGFTPYVGTEKERTFVSIGPGVNFARYCKVRSITPNGTNLVAISAIVEDNRVHGADARYLPQFPSTRPAFYMASGTVGYNEATFAQKSAPAAWAARPDGTVGDQGDAGFTYQ
jgi:hypothetical protein